MIEISLAWEIPSSLISICLWSEAQNLIFLNFIKKIFLCLVIKHIYKILLQIKIPNFQGYQLTVVLTLFIYNISVWKIRMLMLFFFFFSGFWLFKPFIFCIIWMYFFLYVPVQGFLLLFALNTWATFSVAYFIVLCAKYFSHLLKISFSNCYCWSYDKWRSVYLFNVF